MKLSFQPSHANFCRASGYHVDMHDGLLNCFLTFEKFESETIMEAISRKVWIHGPKPLGARAK